MVFPVNPIFKVAFLIISLSFLPILSFGQESDSSGHIHKSGPYYFQNGSSISFDKVIRLLKTDPESKSYAETAINAKRVTTNIAVIGFGFAAARTIFLLRLTSASKDLQVNHKPTLVVGGIALIGLLAGLGSINSSLQKGINIYNSNVAKRPIDISNKVSYHLHFTGMVWV